MATRKLVVYFVGLDAEQAAAVETRTVKQVVSSYGGSVIYTKHTIHEDDKDADKAAEEDDRDFAKHQDEERQRAEDAGEPVEPPADPLTQSVDTTQEETAAADAEAHNV
jgi:hypothetical protein